MTDSVVVEGYARLRDGKKWKLRWIVLRKPSPVAVHRFCVAVLPGTKLETGPATLHLCNNLLALARDVPPVIIGHWNLPDLRRYGPVPNGFVFEGGSRCGYYSFTLNIGDKCATNEQLRLLFDVLVHVYEEKLDQETQELEKRLSMLSHRNSTISSTYCPSAGGDDRSISGSSDTSDTSQSDGSIGSRLVIWSEPATTENSTQLGSTKSPPHSTEKLCVNPGGVTRPALKAPRQLQEIGRQSSSDSGIASGSHSSYTGSFSSYTGSLDMHSTEDSVFTLPPHLMQDLSPCSCPPVPEHEYHVPNSVRYLYDTPRSLLQDGAMGTSQDSETSPLTQDGGEHSGPSAETEIQDTAAEEQTEVAENLTVTEQTEQSEENKTATSSDSLHPDTCHICSAVTPVYKTIVTICSTCGGYKVSPCIPPSGTAPQPLPADEHIDNPLFRTVKDFGIAADRKMQTSGTGITNSKSEDFFSPKKGRDRLVSLLAELLGYTRKVDSRKVNSYESMSPAFWSRSRGARASAIYENCVRCEREQCRPPPRPPPPIVLQNRSASSPACPKPSAPAPSTSQEPVNANEQALDQSRRSQTMEVTGSTPRTEDKRHFAKDERRRTDYEVMESRALEKNSEGEEKSKYELMGSCGHQKFLQETEGSVFVFPPEAVVADRLRSDAVTYVNIPVSPTSKKQLNYMELELQEMGHGPRGTAPHLPAQKKCSTKYAQIDITATETAHKVGTQHALGRQEGLHTLDLRRKATPH
ncbi:hypothetical protein WMY93_014533 [Mugilogobius chulae]|uniref:IRS-type PTB domain-containing protein n=1 Tax=Mugilogobius chulae TaxID=88201 RepID=A0AAW0NVM5_9GOBI